MKLIEINKKFKGALKIIQIWLRKKYLFFFFNKRIKENFSYILLDIKISNEYSFDLMYLKKCFYKLK